jgi:glycosyltransferase involved in cell wall biosynthesis
LFNEKQFPKISIVVPSYNQGDFLQQALESIFSQEYPNLEVIVMDGGSTDRSVEIIQSNLEKLKYWQSQPDGGQADAINMGMRHCTGEIVSWLNSDDWYVNQPFWVVARAYQENPQAGMFVGNGFRYKDNEYTPFCPRHIAISREVLAEGMDYILQPATFISRAAWLHSNGLDAKLHYGLDWDLFIRILEKYPAVAINEFLAVSREYGETKTASGNLTRARELIEIASANFHKEYVPGAAHYLMVDALYEFLAASNEQHKTTPIAGLPAIQQELLALLAQDGRQKTTLGSAFYLMEALLSICTVESGFSAEIRGNIYLAMQRIQHEMQSRWDTPDPFPIHSDVQDHVFIPFAKGLEDRAGLHQTSQPLPKISIIIPSYNQANFIARTLDSILNQKFPSLEIIVYDGGSTDGSVDIIRTYEPHLAYWQSEADHGPAHAINKGFAKATGDIIGWLNSDDVLTEGALWYIAQEFIQNPKTGAVFGNALYIDEKDHIFLADHGTHRTGLYYGKLEPISKVPYYWTYVHAIPQPTVYFRRELLERTGKVDQSYQYIFDFEFFWRLRKNTEFKKIEKILALYRIHSHSKTSSWNKFLSELFRFSRPLWPERNTAEYQATLSSIIGHYFPRHGHLARQVIKFFVEYRITSPEKLATSVLLKKIRSNLVQLPRTVYRKIVGLKNRILPLFQPAADQKSTELTTSLSNQHPDLQARQNPAYAVVNGEKKYTISFCGFHYPLHPGYSGGEIRDFHILRKLLEISTLDFFGLWSAPANDRRDDLRSDFRMIYDPEIIRAYLPHRIENKALKISMGTRFLQWLKERNIPVFGPKYHNDSLRFINPNRAYVIPNLLRALEADQPDFLVIGPQLNPLPLQISNIPKKTRVILSSYDVEAIRLARISASQKGLAGKAMQMEAQRAKIFEQDTVEYYDGIIAVSDTDKEAYINTYQFDPERILVLDNSVDTAYFSYRPRQNSDQPNVVFIGSFGYWPNHEAAMRLLEEIMPLVRVNFPNALAWIIGQSPQGELLALSDGVKNFVTGQVEDVRPFLDMATVACIPLLTGSGTKYKVLEAASAGAPIVCSALALEGLSLRVNDHVLVGDSNLELAEAITQIIQDPESRTNAVKRAAAYVEKYYSWNSNLEKLEPWLAFMMKRPSRSRLSNQVE